MVVPDPSAISIMDLNLHNAELRRVPLHQSGARRVAKSDLTCPRRFFVSLMPHISMELATAHSIQGSSSIFSSSRSARSSKGESTSPFHASIPSRTARAAITSAATESAHSQLNSELASSPMSTDPDR